MTETEPYYDDGGGRVIYLGDAIGVLRQLPDESVNCCVTSPPYWGLRDYGTAEWEGGDERCVHVDEKQTERNLKHSASEQRQGRTADAGKLRDGVKGISSTCPKCGARRIDSQLGLESTPEEYVAKMVEVLREVRRVLRSDGTCWINLGDSYAGASNGSNPSASSCLGSGTGGASKHRDSVKFAVRQKVSTLKPKDLCGIPWRVAFALQADGWCLRQDIIWAKPNPMPESVTDRCTKAHEYVFLLSKSARYWFDADAIRERGEQGAHSRERSSNFKKAGLVGGHHNGAETIECDGYRNKRSVWTIATQPYSEAHFATFPVKLVEPCIKAGCPEGGTVLDPFFGSGTVGLVAARWGRKSIGIELNAEYCLMAIKRLERETIQPELPFEPAERLRQEVLF